MIETSDYFDTERIRLRCDIDPHFIANWPDTIFRRPYTFVPELRDVIPQLGALDYNRLISHGSDLIELMMHSGYYSGILKPEKITPEQIKIATGIDRTDNGNLKPSRLDKALIVIFAINKELERKKMSTINPTIILSAFNLRGLGVAFNKLEATKKTQIRAGLATAIEQSDQFASEFLKGNKVTIDVVIKAHAFLLKHPSFQNSFAANAFDAIETPADKHKQAAQGEDFSKGRLQVLPAPLVRPSKTAAKPTRSSKRGSKEKPRSDQAKGPELDK